MTKVEKINILMQDGCTRNDAEWHLKGDTMIYEDPEDYIQTLKDCNCYDGQTLDQARNGMITDVSIVTVDNHEYLIEYCH